MVVAVKDWKVSMTYMKTVGISEVDRSDGF